MTAINLIPLARRHAKQRRQRTRRWITLTSLYGSLLLLAYTSTRVLWGFDNRALALQLGAVLAEIHDSEESSKSLRAEIMRTRTLWNTSNVVADQPDWSLLLSIVAHSLDDETVLRSCTVRPADHKDDRKPASQAVAGLPYECTVAGLGRSQLAVSQFVLRLENLGLFSSVRLVETRREPFLNSEAIAFRISCAVDEKAEAVK